MGWLETIIPSSSLGSAHNIPKFQDSDNSLGSGMWIYMDLGTGESRDSPVPKPTHLLKNCFCWGQKVDPNWWKSCPVSKLHWLYLGSDPAGSFLDRQLACLDLPMFTCGASYIDLSFLVVGCTLSDTVTVRIIYYLLQGGPLTSWKWSEMRPLKMAENEWVSLGY